MAAADGESDDAPSSPVPTHSIWEGRKEGLGGFASAEAARRQAQAVAAPVTKEATALELLTALKNLQYNAQLKQQDDAGLLVVPGTSGPVPEAPMREENALPQLVFDPPPPPPSPRRQEACE